MNLFILLGSIILVSSSSLKVYPQSTPKLCINCKHFINDNITPSNYIFGKCGFFKETIRDNNNHLIIGGAVVESNYYPYCSTARSTEYLCGEKGKHYIKKNFKKNFEIDF